MRVTAYGWMRGAAFVVALAGALAGCSGEDARDGEGAGATEATARTRIGSMVLEDVPAIPPALMEQLLPYRSTRAARFADWLPRSAGMLVSTRFAETAQLHVVAMPGGAREQLTFFAEPVVGAQVRPLAGSPFGFLYRRDEGGAEDYQLYFMDWQTLRPRLLTDGTSRNSGAVWANGGDRFAYASTRRNGRDQDIYVGTPDGAVRAVLQREGTWMVADWSPDDALLLVQRTVSVGEGYLHVLDLATGQARQLWPAAGVRASVGIVRFARDGNGVYLTSDAASDVERLHYVDLATGTSRVLSEAIPWDIEDLDVAPGGGLYAFVANEDGVSRLHLRQVKRDVPLGVPALPVGVIGNLRFSPESDRLAFTLSSPRAPADVLTLELATSQVQRWTRSEVGGLDAARFVGAERVRIASFDRQLFSAFVYRPRASEHRGRRPVLIDVHGGPEGQARPTFDAMRQFMVDELGIVVIEPNVRGSTGYGKRFRDLDNGLRREDAVRDIGALLDWIQAQPGLDARRVAITGGSYGGYMTLASLARHGARLRAGVSIVGISNFVSFLGSTAPYRQALRRAEYGDERDPVVRAFLDGASPLTQVGKITQPVLIAQGANDPRVPRSESEQMVRSLRQRDVPVWYLLAEDEGHGFRKLQNRALYDAAKVLFLERHLLGRTVPASAPATARPAAPAS
jgi:dipeptidyl aminopeptidase/acylaminoacyl peptidase